MRNCSAKIRPPLLEKRVVSAKLLVDKNMKGKEPFMSTETTHYSEYNPFQSHLFMAFELGEKEWKLGFTIGFGLDPRIRNIKARNLKALQSEIKAAKKRFVLPTDTSVLSCYEAGREGFWLHRYLRSVGFQNQMVDSSSIEVNRKARRAKTDRLDVGKLLTMRMRYHHGEQKVWSVVNVPDPEAEDHRHLHRELDTLISERTKHINRIKGLLAAQGICLSITADFLQDLDSIRLWDGSPLLPGLRARLQREYDRYCFVQAQIKALKKERLDLIRYSDRPDVEMVRHLMRLKGIGVGSAWLYVMEFFAWRNFRNRRQVGALMDLTPTPYQSGEDAREQGISKEGHTFVRAIAIQIAWGWLYHQPHSKLSRWYQKRFGQGSKRMRKIGIVALARKLSIDMWRFLETGRVPEGAVLKTRLL
jgi:transposase